jgi:AAA domain
MAKVSRIRREEATDVIERVRDGIKRASDIDDFSRICIYGRSGAGKTRLAATAPNVLLIDINDKGTKSTKRGSNPFVYPVEYWSEVSDVYWYLQSMEHDFATYALDNITSLQSLCMKFVLGDEASRDASKDPDMPRGPVWQKVVELMKTQITNYRNLPMNGVFVAQQQRKMIGDDDDELGGSLYISPACSPKISEALEAAVDVIGYLVKREVNVKKKGTDKVLRTVRRSRLITDEVSERFLTKDRENLYGTHVDNPDLSEMFALARREE